MRGLSVATGADLAEDVYRDRVDSRAQDGPSPNERHDFRLPQIMCLQCQD